MTKAKLPASPRTSSRTKASSASAIQLGHLTASIGYGLRLASSYTTQQFHEAMRPFGLRPAQFSTLVLIAANPGVRQRDLCETLCIEKANFVGLLDILQERKLIERRPEASDRRRYAIHLTAQGEALLRDAVAAHTALESRLRRRLRPGDRATLLAMLQRLR